MNEYRTLSKAFKTHTPPQPQAPTDDEDWFLVSASAVNTDDAGGCMMYWTWGRPQSSDLIECPTDGCKSIARHEGKCIGCGAKMPKRN